METGVASQELAEYAEGGTSERTGACFVGATSGACVGALIGIPIIGGVAGGTFAGVAATRDDEYGERARKVGRMGARLIDCTFATNKKYNVVGNLKVAGESVLYKAQQLDKKHDIVGRVASASSSVWQKAVAFEDEYKVT